MKGEKRADEAAQSPQSRSIVQQWRSKCKHEKLLCAPHVTVCQHQHGLTHLGKHTHRPAPPLRTHTALTSIHWTSHPVTTTLPLISTLVVSLWQCLLIKNGWHFTKARIFKVVASNIQFILCVFWTQTKQSPGAQSLVGRVLSLPWPFQVLVMPV